VTASTLCKSMRLPPSRATEMLTRAWTQAGDGLSASLAQQIDQHLMHSYRDTVAAINMRAGLEPDAARAQAMRDMAEWINSKVLSGDE